MDGIVDKERKVQRLMILYLWGPLLNSIFCIKETIENAKKASSSKIEEKPEVEDIELKEKSIKIVQELDREKLDAKFSKKEKEKETLN